MLYLYSILCVIPRAVNSIPRPGKFILEAAGNDFIKRDNVVHWSVDNTISVLLLNLGKRQPR